MGLVGKVTSLLFNMLSRLIMAFLSRSKCLLISRLQSPSAVILEPKKIKFITVSTFTPSTCHQIIELDAMMLDFDVEFKLVITLHFHLQEVPCFLPLGWYHLHI